MIIIKYRIKTTNEDKTVEYEMETRSYLGTPQNKYMKLSTAFQKCT